VGHEIDVTLADLAADVRALTPSEAAERVVPAAEDLMARLTQHRTRLRIASLRQLALAESRLKGLAAQRPFRRPFDVIHDRSRRLDELALQGAAGLRGLLHDRQRRFANLAGKLQSLSPLAVLERGYTITQEARTGDVIRSAGQLRVGQLVSTRFVDGTVKSLVEAVDRQEL
jgi:exodeoxyribonuclease VII large subunit